MKAKEEILRFFETHSIGSKQEILACSEATEGAIRTQLRSMVKSGELVITRPDRGYAGLYSRVPEQAPNDVFNECRQNWQGYQIHKIFGSGARA
jgi:DNA-binding transcriptional regulator PaaX